MLQDFIKRLQDFIKRWRLPLVLFWLLIILLFPLVFNKHSNNPIWDQLKGVLDLGPIIIILVSFFCDSPELQRGINKVIEETSTHFIGVFPAHLHHIREMVDNAKISLCIMVDCIDYGSFFDPELHNEVLIAIEKSRRREKPLTVKILITGHPEPISRSSEFYGRPFEELREDKEFKAILDQYLRFHKNFQKNPPTNQAEFTSMLQTQQEKVRGRLYDAGAHIYGLDGTQIIDCNNVGYSQKQQSAALSLPHSSDIFFWIADGESAIFLFFSHKINGLAPKADAPPVNEPDASAIAFRTHDSRLVNIFKSIFAQHWKGP